MTLATLQSFPARRTGHRPAFSRRDDKIMRVDDPVGAACEPRQWRCHKKSQAGNHSLTIWGRKWTEATMREVIIFRDIALGLRALKWITAFDFGVHLATPRRAPGIHYRGELRGLRERARLPARPPRPDYTDRRPSPMVSLMFASLDGEAPMDVQE